MKKTEEVAHDNLAAENYKSEQKIEFDWDAVLEVNITTPMKLMRAATKVMKNARGGGRILNISSLFGVIGRPNRHAYTATKSALAGITRSASGLSTAA